MAFRKLFFKRVQGIRDNYLLQEGDIALDEDDFKLYRGDGSTTGGVVIGGSGGTSAGTVSTGNGTDVTLTGGESTASGSTGGNTIITGGIGITTGGNTNIIGGAGSTTGGNVNINGGNGSTDGNINIGTENTTLITIGTSGNNIDFPATTTVDFTGATVTGLSVSGISNDIKNDTTPQLGGNLDLNNFDITGTGDINITGAVTASGGVTLSGTTDVDTITTDGLTITDNNVSANRTNDDLILSASGTGSININGTVTGTGVLDEDNMASNSANHLATQQSIKAYVDSQSVAFASLTGKPTTLAGYGITDAANTSAETTFTADVKFDTGIQEKFFYIAGNANVIALDCDNGHVHYLTGLQNDITANFTNLGLTVSYATRVSVVINQGATPYEVTAVEIGGGAQTINWHGGSQPTGTPNGVDNFSFTILNHSGTYVVLGEMLTVPSALTDLGISDGTNGQVLTTDGSGSFTFEDSSGGGSSLQSRATKAGTTGSLADAAQENLDITGFKGYALLKVQTDRAARVRIYTDAASRTADASRNEGTDPTSDAGVIAEVITTGAETVLISPGAFGFNNESTPTTTIPCRITNKSGGTSTVVVTLHVLQLES